MVILGQERTNVFEKINICFGVKRKSIRVRLMQVSLLEFADMILFLYQEKNFSMPW